MIPKFSGSFYLPEILGKNIGFAVENNMLENIFCKKKKIKIIWIF